MFKFVYRKKAGNRRRGAASIEYIIVVVAMLGVTTVLALFLYAVKQHSNRTLDLVASEYP
jgi:hypothetical protein